MTNRIGPRMQDALRYIANHPGTAILPVAEYVGPNGSRKYGYATVHRLLKTDLVVNLSSRHGRYELTVRPSATYSATHAGKY